MTDLVIDADLTPALAERIARMALDGVTREWPVAPHHVWTGPADGTAPRTLHPIFYGCYDWHSAVHGHWTLARLLATDVLTAATAAGARDRLVSAITPEAVSIERAYFDEPARASWEWPYGWAWLLALAAELLRSDEPDLAHAGAALRPLADALCDRVAPKLEHMIAPVRVGTHANSAFALGLMWDAAAALERSDVRDAIRLRAQRWFGADTDYPWRYEPSAYDFLSPGLTAAHLMLRVFGADAFASWLDRYWPTASLDCPLAPVTCPDTSDGNLSHLVGLNLSRAWALAAIGAASAESAGRRVLQDASSDHRQAGLAEAFSGHYAGDHWLGTFALYLLTSPT